MKLLTALFLVLFAFSVKAQNPYATLVYDSLVIYDYGHMIEKGNIKKVGKNYEFYRTPTKHIKLAKTEAKEFSDKIGLKSSYSDISDECYDPHFGALYYKGGKAIAYVEICTECNNFQFSHNLGFGTTSMSTTFKKYLKVLLTKYKFSHLPKV